MTSTEIKAEMFDIIVTQENLQGQINKLQEIKQQKYQQLQQVLAEEAQKETADVKATD